MAKLISREEELSLRLLLMSPRETEIKLGLIRICEFYQGGQFFKQAKDIHHTVRGFIYDSRIEVERWALKALVEFRDRSDIDLIRSRLKSPSGDPENFSWTVSAFFAAASEDDINQAIEQKLIPSDGITMLACHYAGRSKIARGRFPFIDIERADSLTLKWATLAIGIGRAKGIFLPKFDEAEQLVALNGHDDPMVCQYSIYAMVRSQRLGFSHCLVKLHNLNSQPKNVRKWLYRLACKDRSFIVANCDAVADIIRYETDPRAREGMALGLRPVWFDGLETISSDWLSREADPGCAAAILEHMGRHSDNVPLYGEIVRDRFATARSDDLLRSRLVNAAAGTRLYAELQRIKIGEEIVPDLFGGEGKFIVVNNTQNFNNSGPVSIGANAVGGKASNDGDQTINFLQDQRTLLQTLRAAAVVEPNKAPAGTVEAIDRLLQNATKPHAVSVLEKLKVWATVGGLSAEVISQIQPVIEMIHRLCT